MANLTRCPAGGVFTQVLIRLEFRALKVNYYLFQM